MYKNKTKLLVVGLVVLVLLLGLVVGAGIVSADEPTEGSMVVTYEDAVSVLGGQFRTDAVETAVATDENGTPACEDWCPLLECLVPCKRLQVTQRPIAHWQSFRCVVLEGSQKPACSSSACAPCPGDGPTMTLASWYAGSLRPGNRLRNTGLVRVGGADNSIGIFVIQVSRLKEISAVEDVLATLNNVRWTIEDGAVANIRVDLLFLGWNRSWEDWAYYTWADLHSHISGTVARIDTDYIQEYMTPGDGLEVESVELRALIARVTEDVKAYARLSSTPAWVAFRVTLEDSNGDVSVQFGSWGELAAEISVWAN